jgi:hypothetical protein
MAARAAGLRAACFSLYSMLFLAHPRHPAVRNALFGVLWRVL